MHILLAILLLLALLFGPQLWARTVLARYRRQSDDFPGTGGEFARHLLNRFGLERIRVEATSAGDHYDPREGVVRLSEENFGSKSLTAIVVAAHEMGHALQHAKGYRPLLLRNQMVNLAQQAEYLGSMAIIALPVIAAISRAPAVGMLMFLVGAIILALPTVVHFITLPVEWDASFRRALPVLEAGGYLNARQLPAARRILKACALTYVAGSLASLLNLWRLIRILRR